MARKSAYGSSSNRRRVPGTNAKAHKPIDRGLRFVDKAEIVRIPGDANLDAFSVLEMTADNGELIPLQVTPCFLTWLASEATEHVDRFMQHEHVCDPSDHICECCGAWTQELVGGEGDG